ncbi:NAD(P)H-hydrate epimerase [Deinococcus malanensis]|uniref:NAD(P)H-hydrate epimerase n=1 Tax=Deinococcus malanensis TaxID=1706855 RepID=UPI00362DDD83
MPAYVLTAAQAAAVDRRLESAGLLDLAMEEAGAAVAGEVQQQVPAGRVLLLAGTGANGGDALVAARHLYVQGREVEVLALPARHRLTQLNRRRLQAVGVQCRPLRPAALHRSAQDAAVLVDGLLGTGFAPPLRAPLDELIHIINAAHCPVLSIDIPSGLDAHSAQAAGLSVHAHRTVTLMGWKPALMFGEAAARAGAVTLVALTVPAPWVQEQALAVRPSDREVGAMLPVRRNDAHKGTAGHVWVLGGHPGTVGAASLAGAGALRAGAGLVTVHSTADVPLVMPELMMHRHEAWDAAFRSFGTRRPDAVAVGMGLGPDAARVAREVLAWNIPTVLDADALQPELTGLGHDLCVWTPIPVKPPACWTRRPQSSPAIRWMPPGPCRSGSAEWSCSRAGPA